MVSVDRIQGLSGSLAIKAPCKAASTAALTLSGEQTVDDIALVEGDRVLVKDQADTTANGVYDVSTGTWTRALDFDGANDIRDGTMVLVGGGTANADLVFKLNATEPIVIGTTGLAFSVATTFTDISAYGASLLDAADAAAARTVLGAVGLTGNETIAGNKTFSGSTTLSGDLTMSGASVVETEGAAVPSASSCNIWATDGNTVHVTGTTGITDFGTAPQAGAWMKLIFDDAVTLTQSANLNVNGGGSDVTTAAGDMALVYADTTTQMDVFVIRKSGASVVTSMPIFSAAYDSGVQTITAGGALVLAHSLGAAPKIIQCLLKCTDASGELGYAQNDYVFVNTSGGDGGSGAVSSGVSIIPDATNLTIRFGANTGASFFINRADTGALASITNTKWAFIVRAYA